jgi:hypothetical protein
MRTTRRIFQSRGRGAVVLTTLALLLTLATTTALAQDQDRTRDQVQDQLRLHDGTGDQQGDPDRLQLRQQIRDGIAEAPGLSAEERGQMTQNLETCLQLGLGERELKTLFPAGEASDPLQARTRLRLQNRVLAAAGEGLPTEPVLAKIQEGLMKGAPEHALEQAALRMEAHVRTANRVMTQAVQDGVEPTGDPTRTRQLVRQMAQNMWSGLNEGDMEQLRQQARLRLRDGSCGVEELAAATETAVQLNAEGLQRARAVRLAGEALQQGYTAQEMRQLRFMVLANHQNGGPVDEIAGDLERCLGEGMGWQEMAQHMFQAGWMGPGEEHEPGGHNPIDDAGGGPGDHQGGSGGQHGGGGGMGGGGS